MLFLRGEFTQDFVAYTSGAEIGRFRLVQGTKHYESVTIIARVTTELSGATSFSTLTFKADLQGAETGVVQADALRISKPDEEDIMATNQAFTGIASDALAVESFEAFKLYPKAGVALAEGMDRHLGIYGEWVSFNVTHNMVGTKAGVLTFDILLKSSDSNQF